MDQIERAHRGKKKVRSVGIDVGLKNLLTLSSGLCINHHPSLPRLKHNLRVWISKLEGQQAGSKRWFETVRIIDKTKRQIEQCQQDHANKIAASLVRHYKIICIEGPINGGTITPEVESDIYIANWDQLRRTIKKKCQETGVLYIEVSPFYTTQTCSRCQNRQKMPLGERQYRCPACGLVLDRDCNAAINIRRKGLEKLERQRKAQEKVGFPPF